MRVNFWEFFLWVKFAWVLRRRCVGAIIDSRTSYPALLFSSRGYDAYS